MDKVTPLRTPAETGLSELFARLKDTLPGDRSAREAAIAAFSERGLPNRRVEEFRYFDLRNLMREAAPPAERPDAAMLQAADQAGTAFTSVEAVRLTLANGHLAQAQFADLPAGIEIVPLRQALAEGHPLLARLNAVAIARGNVVYDLNAAFMADGAAIRISGTVETPIHLRFLNAGSVAFSTATRVLLVVEAGASVTLLETHEGAIGEGLAYQPNDVLEIVAEDGAKVNHVRVNAEGENALALSTLTLRLGAGVSLSSMNVVVGAQASRHQVFAHFAGEESQAQIDGINLLRGQQRADATLVVDHAVPHCTSRETFKTILDGEATGVFQGKIIVRQHAQKTDGGMKSDTLLLSDEASMNNKPELEIFADDVVCGHGATCGALDEDLLFYLKSRGLPTAEAESLLLQAFVGPPLEGVEHEGVREALVSAVEAWLAARR